LRDRTKSDGPKGDASIQNALIYATKVLTYVRRFAAG
jgi:hypothetical protein